jgi:hypothetical protein
MQKMFYTYAVTVFKSKKEGLTAWEFKAAISPLEWQKL